MSLVACMIVDRYLVSLVACIVVDDRCLVSLVACMVVDCLQNPLLTNMLTYDLVEIISAHAYLCVASGLHTALSSVRMRYAYTALSSIRVHNAYTA